MEMFRALAVLIEPPSIEGADADQTRRVRLAELLELPSEPPGPDRYADLFLFQLYPFASVYLGDEGMIGGEARDRIAGFLRTLGVDPPKEPDHLAYLLATYAELRGEESEEPEPRRRARKAFLWEHLLCWLPAWLHKLRQLEGPGGFYTAWADLAEDALRAEAEDLGPPDRLPLHLREAKPLADPDTEGADAFLQSLLAPARSGIILVRDDLRRAARELDLGARPGERRWVLESLLSQDPSRVLGWLANEADGWASAWQSWEWLGKVGVERAERAGSTCVQLAGA